MSNCKFEDVQVGSILWDDPWGSIYGFKVISKTAKQVKAKADADSYTRTLNIYAVEQCFTSKKALLGSKVEVAKRNLEYAQKSYDQALEAFVSESEKAAQL